MFSGTGPFCGCFALLMTSTFVVVGFPVNNEQNQRRTFVTRSPFTYLTLKDRIGVFKDGVVQKQSVGLDKIRASAIDRNSRFDSRRIGGYTKEGAENISETISPLDRLKRCVNCPPGQTKQENLTSARTNFLYDPLSYFKGKHSDEGKPPSNNTLIILPLMATVAFVGAVVAKCCRWAQKDARDLGFIVEFKPDKKKTITKGLMQLHSALSGQNKSLSKNRRTSGMPDPHQLMFLPLFLAGRGKASQNQATFHHLTEIHDPGFDASEDTEDEKKPFPVNSRKRPSPPDCDRPSQSPSEIPPKRPSVRSRKMKTKSIGRSDYRLDSSDEEHIEAEFQKGLALLSLKLNQDPERPSMKDSRNPSRSESVKTPPVNCTMSVQAEVHSPSNELRPPDDQQADESRHSSMDASVDTHDLMEYIENTYGVDIRAFIKVWHHRRRYGAEGNMIEFEKKALNLAKKRELHRTQSAKRPRKPTSSLKRQVSFPLDLTHSQLDPDSSQESLENAPSGGFGCNSVSNVNDDVFEIPTVKGAGRAEQNRSSKYEVQFEETMKDLECSEPTVVPPDFSYFVSELPTSPTSSHHSICDDSGYHNHSFYKLPSASEPALHDSSSDDSAVATNVASESSQSNGDGSPCIRVHSPTSSSDDHVQSGDANVGKTRNQSLFIGDDSTPKYCSGAYGITRTFHGDSVERNRLKPAVTKDAISSEKGDKLVFSTSDQRPLLKDIVKHVNMTTFGNCDGCKNGLAPGCKDTGNDSGVNSPCVVTPDCDRIVACANDEISGENSDIDDGVWGTSARAPLIRNSGHLSRTSAEMTSDRESNTDNPMV